MRKTFLNCFFKTCFIGLVAFGALLQAQQPELVLHKSRNMAVTKLMFSPEGKYLATASAMAESQNHVTIWDVSTWKEIRSFPVGHPISFVFSPDERSLLIGSSLYGMDDSLKHNITQWNIASGELERIIPPKDENNIVSTLKFSQDGRRLISLLGNAASGTINIIDLVNIVDYEQNTLQNTQRVSFSPYLNFTNPYDLRGISISNDAYSVLVSSTLQDSLPAENGFKYPFWEIGGEFPGEVALWEFPANGPARESKVLHTFTSYHDVPHPVALSPDNRYAAWANLQEISIWHIASGKHFRTLKLKEGWVNVIAFSPDSRFLAAGIGNNSVVLWDVQSGKILHRYSIDMKPYLNLQSPLGDSYKGSRKLYTLKKEHNRPIEQLAFFPDSRSLLVNHKYGKMKLWGISPESDDIAGPLLRNIGQDYLLKNNGACKFFANGRYLAFSGGMILDLEKLQTFSFSKEGSFDRTIADISANGKFILTESVISYSTTADITTNIMLSLYELSPEGINVAPSLRFQIPLKDNYGGEEMIHTMVKGIDINNNFVYTVERRHYPVSSQVKAYLTLWDINNGKKIREYDLGKNSRLRHQEASIVLADITSIDFSPDGKTFLTRDGFAPDDTVFSEDGHFQHTEPQYVGRLQIWDIASGDAIQSLAYFPPDDSITKRRNVGSIDNIGAVYSPDGRFILAGGQSGNDSTRLFLWDVSNGKVMKQYGTIASGEFNYNSLSHMLGFSPDGKYVWAASPGWKGFTVWETINGKKVHSGFKSGALISGASFSQDGRLLATGDRDTSLKLWDFASGELLVSLLAYGPEAPPTVVTPNNYYSTGRNGLAGLHFVDGADVYTAENFDLIYNRPDIILERIGYAAPALIDAYRAAYLKRVERMGFKEAQLKGELHLPTIQLDKTAIPYETRQSSITAAFTAKDDKYHLDRINVYVNDVPIFGSEGIAQRDAQTFEITRKISIPLTPGRNKIQVSAHNIRGMESHKETVEVQYSGTAPSDLYLLVIGVSEYQDSRYNLTYAAKDANDLAEFFSDNNSYFRRVLVKKMINENAVRDSILATKSFLEKSTVNDQAILLVAGHGLLDENLDYYFATHDIDINNPAEKGLPYQAIEDLLDGIPARKKLLLMDTCHSGEIDKTENVLAAANNPVSGNVKTRSFRNITPIQTASKLGLANSFSLMQELFANLQRGSGAFVIAAASGSEVAYEDNQWQNGAFTYAVLEGLKSKNADMDGDDIINVAELKSYVVSTVNKLTKGRQTPVVRREQLEFDYRIF